MSQQLYDAVKQRDILWAFEQGARKLMEAWSTILLAVPNPTDVLVDNIESQAIQLITILEIARNKKTWNIHEDIEKQKLAVRSISRFMGQISKEFELQDYSDITKEADDSIMEALAMFAGVLLQKGASFAFYEKLEPLKSPSFSGNLPDFLTLADDIVA